VKVYIGKYPKDSSKDRKIDVRIDDYDVWDMYTTLSYVILPMLKILKEKKHGAPGGMEGFKQVAQNQWPQKCFDFYSAADAEVEAVGFKQWDEIMDKMIWSFEQINLDWEDQYWITHPELDFADYPEDEGKLSIPVRWLVEGECDWDARMKHADKIQEGFELFGKYYQNLWD
jgi:hypothetical protein